MKPLTEISTQCNQVPVHASFDRAKHVHDSELTLATNAEGRLTVSIDTGLNPGLVIMEMTPFDRLNVYDAVSEFGTPANLFAESTVIPLLKFRHKMRYHRGQFDVVVTPLENQCEQSDEAAAYNIYRKLFGNKVEFAATNLLHPRLAASERFLISTDKNGDPALRICPTNAGPLTETLATGYHYSVENGVPGGTPATSYPASSLAAAFQYGCLFADNGETFGCEIDKIAVARECPDQG